MIYSNIIPLIFMIMETKSVKDLSAIVDIESLSELPLEALLNIRKNIFTTNPNNTDDEAVETKESNDPEAQAFRSPYLTKNKRGYQVQYSEDYGHRHEKKSITKIFQISVTSLAFLAFGGYLLFLIITAIRGKNYSYIYDPNATQIMAAMINAERDKRRKKKRRPIRGDGNLGYKHQEQSFEKISLMNSEKERELGDHQIHVEEMYDALVNLCEGYSKIAALNKSL